MVNNRSGKGSKAPNLPIIHSKIFDPVQAPSSFGASVDFCEAASLPHNQSLGERMVIVDIYDVQHRMPKRSCMASGIVDPARSALGER